MSNINEELNMKRKIVSCGLAASFLIYAGCYDSVELTKEKLIQTHSQTDISVVTKLCRRYEFKTGSYSISGDSLFGVGMQKLAPPFKDVPFQDPIALSDIVVIETREFNTGKTILLAGGIALGVAGIVALSNGGNESAPPPPPPSYTGGKFSCPFLYTFDGSKYHFESETFSGSVFKGLERTAFDVLYHLKPTQGLCKLKLVNAREETEYVNHLSLIAVDHPVGTAILPDRTGVMRTISAPVHPVQCLSYTGKDVLTEILSRDSVYWFSTLSGREWTDERNFRDGLIVEFPKPDHATSVKLIVSGKNTLLGYFALATIFQLKGASKVEWYRQLETDSTERAKFVAWLMRQGMLHVQLCQNGKWVERGAFIDVGPGISKEQIMVLNIRDVTENMLKVRLECTTDLWRIDQVYADYSPDLPVHSVEMIPVSATSEHGQDVSNLLNASDDRYYVTVSNQYADIEFSAVPETNGCERSYVAKTQGFYYQWLNADGPSQDVLVDQILSGDQVGTRVLMSQWVHQRARYEAISELH